MTDNPALSPRRQPEDPDAALRPKSLGEFVGQEAALDEPGAWAEPRTLIHPSAKGAAR